MRNFGYLVVLAMLTCGCAQINPLSGGADDDYAPAIDSAKSYPANGQINFEGDEIKLRFDEYITLVKPSENILIIPAPVVPPVIEAHNKTLRIKFLVPLEDSTTYTVNFNHAIADITEKNDSVFQYVFSTGNYIDSLSLQGRVLDAYTNLPADGFLVALYPVNEDIQFDSVPYKIKPVYISESNKSGEFKMNYLKGGDYWLFAISDLNKNLKLDAGESLGFLTQEVVHVGLDQEIFLLRSYLPEDTSVVIDHVNFSDPGKLEIIFSGKPHSFSVSTVCDLLPEETGKSDSLIWWLSRPPVPKMRFATDLNGYLDTLKPIYKTQTEQEKKLTWTSNITAGRLYPGEHLEITFSEPIDSAIINSGEVYLILSDSIKRKTEVEVQNLRKLVLKNVPDELFTVMIDSGMVRSIYGLTNALSISLTAENHPASYYGSLVVNTDTSFNESVLVYLLDSKGEILDTVAYAATMKFEELLPGSYQLMAVFDSDEDGKWTSGSLTERRLPEKVIYFNGTVEVKSKWMKEVDWILTQSGN